MSWCRHQKLTCSQDLALQVIKCGPVPKHIALIMDGNRRYAKSKNIEVEVGHRSGAQKLKELAFWCKKIGIPEITVYAASIENFKRKQTEVDALVNLGKSEFEDIVSKCQDFLSDDIRVRFVGNLELLAKDIRKIVSEVTFWTQHCKSFTVNIAMSYTSREEITNAIGTVVGGVRTGDLETADIDEDLLTRCMYTNLSRDPEILIRTSGETRFSDFMLWQTHQHSRIFIENFMWPELTVWHFLKIIFQYQISHRKNLMDDLKFEPKQLSTKKEEFLKKLNQSRVEALKRYVKEGRLNST